jgi:hypothetical protein
MPASKRIVGQAYRLDALPATLVAEGVIEIDFLADPATVATAANADAIDPALHVWDGESWQALATTIQRLGGGEDGLYAASAESAGAGVYAVLYEQPVKEIWMPLVHQP